MLMLAVVLIAQAPKATPPALMEAQQLYGEQRYREALAPLATVIDDPASTSTVRVQALELKAFCLYLMESYPEARHVWQQLLALDPEHRPDPVMTSPDLLEFFEEVRRASTAPAPSAVAPAPRASPTAPPSPPEPEPARIGVVSPRPAAKETCAPYLCLLPLGGGQFVNGRALKGVAFLGVDVIALTMNLGLYYRRVLKYDSTKEIPHLKRIASGRSGVCSRRRAACLSPACSPESRMLTYGPDDTQRTYAVSVLCAPSEEPKELTSTCQA